MAAVLGQAEVMSFSEAAIQPELSLESVTQGLVAVGN